MSKEERVKEVLENLQEEVGELLERKCDEYRLAFVSFDGEYYVNAKGDFLFRPFKPLESIRIKGKLNVE